MNALHSEIERTQQLLLELSQKRQQLCLRIDELRRELAALHAKHPKRLPPSF